MFGCSWSLEPSGAYEPSESIYNKDYSIYRIEGVDTTESAAYKNYVYDSEDYWEFNDELAATELGEMTPWITGVPEEMPGILSAVRAVGLRQIGDETPAVFAPHNEDIGVLSASNLVLDGEVVRNIHFPMIGAEPLVESHLRHAAVHTPEGTICSSHMPKRIVAAMVEEPLLTWIQFVVYTHRGSRKVILYTDDEVREVEAKGPAYYVRHRDGQMYIREGDPYEGFKGECEEYYYPSVAALQTVSQFNQYPVQLHINGVFHTLDPSPLSTLYVPQDKAIGMSKGPKVFPVEGRLFGLVDCIFRNGKYYAYQESQRRGPESVERLLMKQTVISHDRVRELMPEVERTMRSRIEYTHRPEVRTSYPIRYSTLQHATSMEWLQIPNKLRSVSGYAHLTAYHYTVIGVSDISRVLARTGLAAVGQRPVRVMWRPEKPLYVRMEGGQTYANVQPPRSIPVEILTYRDDQLPPPLLIFSASRDKNGWIVLYRYRTPRFSETFNDVPTSVRDALVTQGFKLRGDMVTALTWRAVSHSAQAYYPAPEMWVELRSVMGYIGT